MNRWMMAVLLAAISAGASAAQGEVCKTPPKDLHADPQAAGVDNETRYDCPTLGKVTIPEVYRKGWRIAAIYSNVTTDVTARVERIILIERLD